MHRWLPRIFVFDRNLVDFDLRFGSRIWSMWVKFQNTGRNRKKLVIKFFVLSSGLECTKPIEKCIDGCLAFLFLIETWVDFDLRFGSRMRSIWVKFQNTERYRKKFQSRFFVLSSGLECTKPIEKCIDGCLAFLFLIETLVDFDLRFGSRIWSMWVKFQNAGRNRKKFQTRFFVLSSGLEFTKQIEKCIDG